MRKQALVWLVMVGVLLLAAAPSDAWHHGRGGVFIGVGPGYGWGYPYWYPPPYYPPPVIVEEPPVYIQQDPAPPPAPPAYWYYCLSAQGYYPSVEKCPEAWVKVPARAQ